MKANTFRPTFLDPTRLYSLQGFIADAGISSNRIHHARKAGIELPMLAVGRRKYIRGADAIAYVERLAEWEAEKAAEESVAAEL